MKDFPHVFSRDQVWLLDRLWHGVPRLKALAGLTHWTARLKSGITLKKISEILPDHAEADSYTTPLDVAATTKWGE